MRRLLLLCLPGLLAASVPAEAPCRIVAVERKGLPPYESADRVYLLEGGRDRGLRVGQRLTVRRPGSSATLGHLAVVEVRDAVAESRFEPAPGSMGAPLKGDLAWRTDLAALPELPPVAEEAGAPPSSPKAVSQAPPREGLLFFLPQRAELSPAGQEKLRTWVEGWGADGRWAVQVPVTRALKPALQKQRAEALQAALQALGVAHAEVETEARAAEGKYDPAWIRHWD
ncbi:hypothetical protein [Geothrix sp. 21YS21S-4]|uniref:hypothetical protein n=1 Tax=Geothrix sp. 21YS21S-4 TaxID=3068889 RepID=UPI0027B95016|nr:hypothetical protein [Geothrix sp. 21YS21S-4]